MAKVAVYKGYNGSYGVYGYVVDTGFTYRITSIEPADTDRNAFIQVGSGFVFSAVAPDGTPALAYTEGGEGDEVQLFLNDENGNRVLGAEQLSRFDGNAVFLASTSSGTGLATQQDLMITDGDLPPRLVLNFGVQEYLVQELTVGDPEGDEKETTQFIYALSTDGRVFRVDEALDEQEILVPINRPTLQIDNIFAMGDRVFARGWTNDTQNDLYEVDPITNRLVELNVAENSGGDDFRLFDGAIGDSQFFYWFPDADGGIELHVYDGTAGTKLVADIREGSASSYIYGANHGAMHATIGDTYIFTADAGTSDDEELWISDGTPAGTKAVSATDPEIGPLDFSNPSWIQLGDDLLFTAAGDLGYELYKFDSASEQVELVANINTDQPPRSDDSRPKLWVADESEDGNFAYFSIERGPRVDVDEDFDEAVWVTDGTPEGTRMVSDPDPENGTQPPEMIGILDIDVEEVLSPDGLIVFTHGWSDIDHADDPFSYLSSLSEAARVRLANEGKTVQIVDDLRDADLSYDVTILEYVWDEAFTRDPGFSLIVPAYYNLAFTGTTNAGLRLANQIDGYLARGNTATGLDFDPNVHMVGHSLGTMVNAYAVETLYQRDSTDAIADQFTILDDPLGVGEDPKWTYLGRLLRDYGLFAEVENYLNLYELIASNGQADVEFFNNHLPNGSVEYVENYYGNQLLGNQLFSATPYFGNRVIGAGPGNGGQEIDADHTEIWQDFYYNLILSGEWSSPVRDGWSAPNIWNAGTEGFTRPPPAGTFDPDLIAGTPFSDALAGLAGNDTIRGGLGSDYVFGGENDDNLGGDAGDDVLSGDEGADTINGDDGNDIVLGGVGNDELRGGAGDDMMDGGADDDRLKGLDGADWMDGGLGNDRLFGGIGNDTMTGGEGLDRFKGGSGADSLSGDDDYDRLKGEAGNDEIFAGNGNDRAWGGNGRDDMYGGDGNDRMKGQDGDDRLWGEEGNDRVFGGEGNDTLDGGAGNDKIGGDAGDDVLDGGLGNDTLTGGDDADVFIFSAGADVITDFQDGIDTLSLNRNLWTGDLTIEEVLDTFASPDAGDTVFDFQNGAMLRLTALADPDLLLEDINFF